MKSGILAYHFSLIIIGFFRAHFIFLKILLFTSVIEFNTFFEGLLLLGSVVCYKDIRMY